MKMLTATINRETLSDGSHVYRVTLADDGDVVTELEAFDEKAAESFAADLMTLIHKNILIEHSSTVRYGY